jgi:hypothetical protein
MEAFANKVDPHTVQGYMLTMIFGGRGSGGIKLLYTCGQNCIHMNQNDMISSDSLNSLRLASKLTLKRRGPA